MSRPARRHNEPSPVDTIVLTHHESMTAPQMSLKFGYHSSSLHKAAKRVGVELMVRRGRKSANTSAVDISAAEAIQEHHETMNVYEISDKFGFSYKHLMEVAKKLGLKMVKPKKPQKGHSATVEGIINANPTMTANEMADKFGYHISSFYREVKKLAIVLPKGRKKVEPKPRKTPPVMKNRPIPEAKPRKESNNKNPDRFKMKKVSYEGLRMLPVGIDNQYFYVAQDASEEEIGLERARRRERIEAKKRNERLTAL